MSTVEQSPPPFVESVVHATDFSSASEPAFAHALAIALLRRASFTLLHVGKDAGLDSGGFPAVRKTLERWGLLKPGAAQADVFAQVGVAVTKVAIDARSPALAIASYLDRVPSDLLVVATGARDGLARWLHGSVAEAAARWSRTMTLFVPVDAPRGIVALADGSLTLHNVLIPVDRAPDPSAAIEFARRAAEVAGEDGDKVKITLLHVGTGAPRVRAEDGPRCIFRRVSRAGDPVEEIVKAADAVAAELIVMPTEGRTGVFDVLRGSTTERVLRRAPCPLLAVPAGRND